MEASGLVGVVIGGLIGLAGSIAPHLWEKRRARQSAQALAYAYISGILKMEEVRQHGSLYAQNLAGLRSGASQSLMKIFGAEDYPNDPIQKVLIDQIGLLEPDIARDLVIFGSMLDGLRVDLKAMALGQMDNLQVSEKIRILEHDLKLWQDTQTLGQKLIRQLAPR
jgi:hypothetical protein